MRTRKWLCRTASTVFDVVAKLKNALQADYVVLGGGNARRLLLFRHIHFEERTRTRIKVVLGSGNQEAKGSRQPPHKQTDLRSCTSFDCLGAADPSNVALRYSDCSNDGLIFG